MGGGPGFNRVFPTITHAMTVLLPPRFGKLSIYPFQRDDQSSSVLLSVYKKRAAKGLQAEAARQADPDVAKVTVRALAAGESGDVLSLSTCKRLTRKRLLATLKGMIERGDLRDLPVPPAGGGVMRRFLPTGQSGRELYEANKTAMLALLDDPRVQISVRRIRENGRDVERIHIVHLPGDPV